MTKLSGFRELELIVHETKNLDTTCYRGSAPLAQLAMISQADIYDQVSNPEGLQRDLSPKHASDAYEYAHRSPEKERPRAFPEVVLNVRDKKMVLMEEISIDCAQPGLPRVYRLRFDLERLKGGKVSVSRVDGNHRLFYAVGDERRDPLLAMAPFQIHIGLTREQERSLFVDINSNQKGLNTSHLAMMQSKLTAEEVEIRDHLDRWITNRLANDPLSPWHGQIHHGGSKKGSRAQGLTRLVNFVSLQAGVNRTLAKSHYIHDLTDPNAQYIVIRNFWQAVRMVFAEEWANPKAYLLAKNIGVMSLSILGGTIIDRCIPKGRVSPDDMAQYVGQVRSRFDWRTDAQGDRAVTGMSGNRAAMIVAGALASELSNDNGENLIKDLQEKLLSATR